MRAKPDGRDHGHAGPHPAAALVARRLSDTAAAGVTPAHSAGEGPDGPLLNGREELVPVNVKSTLPSRVVGVRRTGCGPEQAPCPEDACIVRIEAIIRVGRPAAFAGW